MAESEFAPPAKRNSKSKLDLLDNVDLNSPNNETNCSWTPSPAVICIPLLQPFVYKYLQLTGLYPRNISLQHTSPEGSGDSKSSPTYPVQIFPALLSIGVVMLSLFNSIVFQVTEWQLREQQMANLEFFALLHFILTLSTILEVPMMLLFMVWNSRDFIPLIKAVEAHLNQVRQSCNLSRTRFH